MQLLSVLDLIVEGQCQHSTTFKHFAVRRKSGDKNEPLRSLQLSC